MEDCLRSCGDHHDATTPPLPSSHAPGKLAAPAYPPVLSPVLVKVAFVWVTELHQPRPGQQHERAEAFGSGCLRRWMAATDQRWKRKASGRGAPCHNRDGDNFSLFCSDFGDVRPRDVRQYEERRRHSATIGTRRRAWRHDDTSRWMGRGSRCRGDGYEGWR
jgi:hypothetical protein